MLLPPSSSEDVDVAGLASGEEYARLGRDVVTWWCEEQRDFARQCELVSARHLRGSQVPQVCVASLASGEDTEVAGLSSGKESARLSRDVVEWRDEKERDPAR